MLNLFKMILFFILSSYFVFGCAHVFNPKGINLEAEGKFSELEKHMEIQIKDQSNAPTSELYLLCRAYQQLKKYKKLFYCLDCLQARIDDGDISGYMGFAYPHKAAQLRAETYIELGQYNKAIEQAKLAYDYVTKYAPKQIWIIETLTVYGLSCALGGNKNKAEEITKMLNSLDTSSHIYEILDRPKKTGLAKIYVALGLYQKAYGVAFQKITFDYSWTGERVFIHEKLAHNFIKAKCLFEIGRLDDAKLFYDQLLGLQQIRDSGTIYWNTLFDRGCIELNEGEIDKAIEYFKKAIEIIEQQRSTINTEVGKIGFVGDKQKVYQTLISALFNKGDIAEAFEYAERGKARALVDMLATKKHFFGGDVDTKKATALLEELENAEKQSLTLAYQDDPSGKVDSIRALKLIKKEEITNISPQLASLISINTLDVTEIQQLLTLDETLVEYYGSGDRFFIFVVNGNSVRGIEIEVKGLQKEIQVFRKHIMLTPDEIRGLIVNTQVVSKANAYSRYNKLNVIGEALYQKLIQPIKGMITTKNLTIVPHGILHYLPFNALNSKDGYLIERYNIRVLPSSSVMQFLKARREGQAGELIVLGNPDLGDQRYDLPFAEAEALAIAKEQPNSKVLTRKQASETSLKKFAGQFKRVHFATHGTFNPDIPLKSGLLLSRDNVNDGMLTVGELYDLKLNADLVTLSACETALGKVANGDDLVGFTRGFLYAGTNSIVSSLWKVDDQATSILMKKFYRHLKKYDKRTALRKAQLAVKQTYSPHPFFWAAFQLTGSAK